MLAPARVHLVVAAAVLSLSACAASDASPTPSSATPQVVTVDCGLAITAMSDYGTAVMDLATSVQANDSMSAVAAADAMGYAIDQLAPVINAAGVAAQGFATRAQAVAVLVKSAAAAGTPMQEALPAITEAFNDPAFDAGGEALQAYVDRGCPLPPPMSAAPPSAS